MACSDEENSQVEMFSIDDDAIVGPKSAKRSSLAVARLPAADDTGKKFKLVRQ